MILPLCLLNIAAETPLPEVEGLTWRELEIASTYDGAQQPIIVGVPDGYVAGAATPLLVALHTWSAGHTQQPKEYGPHAAERGWLLVMPHFRGPNLTSNPKATEAGGSIAAQHDIIDAVESMKREYSVDAQRIYVSGASGGGHMALLMAGKYPDVWAAVCSWCPATDLRDWHAVGNNYAQHIEAVCGGPPGASPEVDFEYLRRSPRTFITNAAPAHILFAHGNRDYTIPTDQSWETFSRLREVGRHNTVFRSWGGGHEARPREGLDWAAGKFKAAEPPAELHIVTDEAKWYFWLFVEPAAPLTLGRAVATVEAAGLKLVTEGAARVSIDTRELHLASGLTVLVDGADAAEGVARDDDILTLHPPDADRHEWTVR